MSPIFFRFAVLAALAFGALTTQFTAHAGPLADNEAQKVREVIVAQLEAFADDDADKAFSTATPGVRQAIGSSHRFLAMVRGAYPMVYRHTSISFLKPEEDEGTVLQLVEITDGNEKSWLALFAMERQPDNSWAIGGCAVAENHWQSI